MATEKQSSPKQELLDFILARKINKWCLVCEDSNENRIVYGYDKVTSYEELIAWLQLVRDEISDKLRYGE